MAVVSMNFLLEAGVHFGHQTKRWNPKMKEYIFTARDEIHIIDLQKTQALIEESYAKINEIAGNGGQFLFIGTKKQASEVTKEEAERSKSFYVVERWLGGTLTNFRTIRRRIKRLEEIETMEKDGVFEQLPKKEVIGLKKEYDKLNKVLGGIREMSKLPQGLIVVDPKKEINAIREARKLNIPVFGLVDTNNDPDDVDYVIPANDDAVRSVKLVLGVLANAICQANNLEMIDFISEEDKKENEANETKEEKVDVKTETAVEKTEVEEKSEVVEEKQEETKEEVKVVKKAVEKTTKKENSLNVNMMSLMELKAVAKTRGVKGYSTMKKDELIESLK